MWPIDHTTIFTFLTGHAFISLQSDGGHTSGYVLGTQTWTSSNFPPFTITHFNSLATELSVQCTLQNTRNFNGHPILHILLAGNFQGIWFTQNHTVALPKSSFSTEEPNTKHEMCLMSQLPPLSCYYADHSPFTPVLSQCLDCFCASRSQTVLHIIHCTLIFWKVLAFS